MSDFVFPFEKLDVWQLSIELTDYVLEVLNDVPANKYLRLVSQFQSAASSVPQNIAEGKGRQ
jgi:four helix bundle protein